jgi:peptidoglycan/LPS O-acetylase OafA/YrhL
MPNSHPYLNNLTPLRGAAATWVAVYHFGTTVPLFSPDQTMLVAKGYTMVDLFFIMSGFIMQHVYGQSFKAQITQSGVYRFIVARFARIYPLHFFTLATLVVLTSISGNWNLVNDPSAILTNVFLLQSFPIERLSTWNRPSWSLSAEWAAYMVFPLLALFFSRRRKLAYWVVPMILLLAYVALVYWIPPAGIGNRDRLILHKLDVTYDYGFLRGIAGFTLGMLGHGLYSNIKIREFFGKDWVAAIVILALLVCMHVGANDLLLVAGFFGIVLCFAANSGHLHRLCQLRFPQFVGKVSYSIYLIQSIVTMLFVQLVRSSGIIPIFPPVSFPQRFLYLLVYLALLIGCSAVTYYGIESPCRNFINRKFRPLGGLKTERRAAV